MENEENNVENNTQNSQPELSEKEIEKQQTHDASKKTAHIAGKVAATYFGGEKGAKIYDIASKTKPGQKVEELAGKAIEKSSLGINNNAMRKADEKGVLDVATQIVDSVSSDPTKINQINNKMNPNFSKGSKAKSTNQNISNINNKHDLVTRPKVEPKTEENINSEKVDNVEKLEEKINNENTDNKKEKNANFLVNFLKNNPLGVMLLVTAAMIGLVIFYYIYTMVTDMDLVGTGISEYSEAEYKSGYCNEIILVKEHPSFSGTAVSSIDDVDLTETFTLNNKSEQRWSTTEYNLEEYVKGVLQAEALNVKDEKTFEVASIAARTYALQIANDKCYTWDNTNTRTTYRNPQNFTTDTPDSSISSAVTSTSGVVITLNDELVNMDNYNYYDYFCHEGKDVNDENHAYLKMLQENEEERLLIPIDWAKENVNGNPNIMLPNGDYQRSGKYDSQCQKEGMSLYGAKYLLNKKMHAYTTFRILKYYYGYDIEFKKVSNISIFNGGCYHWPLSIRGTITSDFGYRVSPTTGASSNHKGIDVGVPEGTQVLATASGTVTKAGAASGYGYAVFIDHGNGLTSEYGHLKANGIQVKVGDNVTQGQVIALSGNTGVSTGPHLHFQIELNGTAINPLNYVSQDNPTPSCENLVLPGGNYTGSSKADFIAFIAPFAVNDMHASNILASVTIAQAALESGWGTSSLARNYNNYFGVKAIGGWNGSSVNMGTTECEGTRCYATSANWRIYASPQESIADHSKVLSAKRYNGVIGERNYKTAIQIIKNGGYATDPDYVSKIVSIIEKNELYKYDTM